jgi:hypothetical protein
VLSAFKQSGRFAEPNAFANADALAGHIASLTFHAPKVSYKALLLRLAARLLGRRGVLIQYRPGTERICVIRRS